MGDSLRNPSAPRHEGVPTPVFLARYDLGPGVVVTVTENSAAVKEITVTAENGHQDSPLLQWGIVGDQGEWKVPAEELWPDGTALYQRDESGLGAVRTRMKSLRDGVHSAKIYLPVQAERIAFVLHHPETGYDNNRGSNYTVPFNSVRFLESTDSHYRVRVEEVTYYPPVFDFLLSRFPHTMALRLTAQLPPQLGEQIRAWIESGGPDSTDLVHMLPRQAGNLLILEGSFLPPQPGLYHWRIVLGLGRQQFVIEQGERQILAPLSHERWTQGPLSIEIAEGLFLGNLAAVADPQFLEEKVGGNTDSCCQVAVVNAAAERDPRPALFRLETRRQTPFVYRQFPFTDFSHNPLNKEELWRAVKWIHEQRKKGAVFVHCHAGIGRSASLIVAYLRLFLHPEESYDQAVGRVKEAAGREGHVIFPHVGLPETLHELQQDEGCQRELAALLSREGYECVAEPVGEVKAVSLIGGYEVGQEWTLRKGAEIVVQARVEYEGAEPCGVLVHTNLSGKSEEIVMRRVGRGVYRAEVKVTREGNDFWLTVSATTRRHDHDVKRKWIGGNIFFRVS